jgi:hypothetical protein
MNKRGMAVEALIKGILMLLIAVVLISVAVRFAQFYGTESKIEKCRLSVLANSRVNAAAEGSVLKFYMGVTDLPISCPAPVTEITGKLGEQKLKVAEELRSCWYKMGEGNLKVFGTDYVAIASNLGDKAMCLVCSQFKTKDNIYGAEFKNFLSAQNISGKIITYQQYLSLDRFKDYYIIKNFDTQSKMWINTLDTPGTLNTPGSSAIVKDKDYFVVFMRAPINYIQTMIGELYLNSNTKEDQYIMIIPKEDLAKSDRCYNLFWEKE